MTNAAGVGCFKGCGNPVVGQCSGYEGTCGQFYCAEHSSNKLCAECAERKAHDERVQALYEEYLAEAQKINPPGCYVWGLIIFLGPAAIVGVIGIYNIVFYGKFNGDMDIAGIVALLLLFMAVMVLLKLKKRLNAELKRLSDEKLGFEEFYKEWKSQKNKEALMMGIGLAVGAVGAATAMHQSNQQKQAKQNLQDLRDDIRKISKR